MFFFLPVPLAPNNKCSREKSSLFSHAFVGSTKMSKQQTSGDVEWGDNLWQVLNCGEEPWKTAGLQPPRDKEVDIREFRYPKATSQIFINNVLTLLCKVLFHSLSCSPLCWLCSQWASTSSPAANQYSLGAEGIKGSRLGRLSSG